jgi:hypothetical protein
MQWRAAPLAFMVLAVLGCRAVVDSGISYTECKQTNYAEPFQRGSTLKAILEKCWLTSDASTDPDDSSAELMLEDGDLVIRSNAPANGATAQWQGENEGPVAYQRFEGNFVMATRVEALDKVKGDHCLPEGEGAGLVLRRADQTALEWTTFLIAPFEPVGQTGLSCEEDAMNPLPTLGVVDTNAFGQSHTERGANDKGIGNDGEADIAICRVDGSLTFYFREPTEDESMPIWRIMGGENFAYSDVTGPVEVGLTVAGREAAEPTESFRVAAHFQWALLTDTVLSDGCEETLLAFEFPSVE